MNEPWCSIIVPTLVEKPPILHHLPPREALRNKGIELIVVWDKFGWRNASLSRNIGAAVSNGDVLFFVDDDSGIDWEKTYDFLRDFHMEGPGRFVWHDPPHVLLIFSSDFIRCGGYDERFKPTMAETVELKLRLTRMGLKCMKLSPAVIDLIHLREHPNPRYLLNQKHLAWAYIEHRYSPLHKLILRKNPVEMLRRIKWILEWTLYRRWLKRRIFT